VIEDKMDFKGGSVSFIEKVSPLAEDYRLEFSNGRKFAAKVSFLPKGAETA
jgi:hypothetical protein